MEEKKKIKNKKTETKSDPNVKILLNILLYAMYAMGNKRNIRRKADEEDAWTRNNKKKWEIHRNEYNKQSYNTISISIDIFV